MPTHLRHLIALQHLGAETLEHLLDRAESLREACAHGTRRIDLLRGRTVLNLFFEPSTRTRTSFELAARRLGGYTGDIYGAVAAVAACCVLSLLAAVG